MPLKALLLAAMIGPAVADDQVGRFQLEPHSHQSQPQPALERPDVESLKQKAMGLARRWAVYLNTHPVIGNPDLPEEYRDILPHEAFGKLKDSFKDLMREKMRERNKLTETRL